MFRNQYDTDVTTWSPQGRIHQIEYAMEAVKQGAAAVGLRSKTHVVLASLKRATSELASHTQKVFKIDDHMAIATSGLAADGRILCRYLRNECIRHSYVFESPMPTGRLVRQLADKSQLATQGSGSASRPYGVGLLVAGWDKGAGHLYYNCPSGNYYEYKAFAIGARSQAAKTYLERTFESYPEANMDELIGHSLKALQASLADGELTKESISVAVVGSDLTLTLLDQDAVQQHITALKDEDADGNGDGATPPAAAATPAAVAAAPSAAAAAGSGAAAAGADGETDNNGATPMED